MDLINIQGILYGMQVLVMLKENLKFSLGYFDSQNIFHSRSFSHFGRLLQFRNDLQLQQCQLLLYKIDRFIECIIY